MADKDLVSSNSYTLRDCFSAELLRRIATPDTKKAAKRQPGRYKKGISSTKSIDAAKLCDVTTSDHQQQQNDAEELAEFIDYLSQEIFDSLPLELQCLSYSAIQADPSLAKRMSSPHDTAIETLLHLQTSISESLTAYALLPATTSVQNLLVATLTSYVQSTTAAPPVWSNTKASAAGCEICSRDWVPLTYHHLIPKSTHERARKRGWHEDWMLNSVAWLCRACHNYVHSIESNEGLAKDYYTVEKLLARDDVRRWAHWVGKVRWKAR